MRFQHDFDKMTRVGALSGGRFGARIGPDFATVTLVARCLPHAAKPLQDFLSFRNWQGYRG